MGKSLIIKGADFSANGMQYESIDTIVNKLYGKGTGQGSLVEINSSEWPLPEADGRVYYNASHGNDYYLLKNMQYGLVSNKVAVGDNDHVKVRTKCELGGDYVIMACIDSNEVMLGGYVTTSGAVETFLTKAGAAIGWREFEMDIPEGTTHVIATYICSDGSTPFGNDGFKITLTKYTIG